MACREGDCVCIGDIESETVQGYSAGGRGKFKWKKSGEGKAFMPVCVKVFSFIGFKPSHMLDKRRVVALFCRGNLCGFDMDTLIFI